MTFKLVVHDAIVVVGWSLAAAWLLARLHLWLTEPRRKVAPPTRLNDDVF